MKSRKLFCGQSKNFWLRALLGAFDRCRRFRRACRCPVSCSGARGEQQMYMAGHEYPCMNSWVQDRDPYRAVALLARHSIWCSCTELQSGLPVKSCIPQWILPRLHVRDRGCLKRVFTLTPSIFKYPELAEYEINHCYYAHCNEPNQQIRPAK